MRTPLALPSELSIYTVADVRAQWLERIAQDPVEPAADALTWTVLGAAVDTVDAAGVQLLVSLHRTLAQRGEAMRLVGASAPLTSGCVALGLFDTLCTEPGAGATP